MSDITFSCPCGLRVEHLPSTGALVAFARAHAATCPGPPATIDLTEPDTRDTLLGVVEPEAEEA